jgi:hypothetical protein
MSWLYLAAAWPPGWALALSLATLITSLTLSPAASGCHLVG